MSKYVMRDAFISINGTAFSDHCSAVELSDTADQVEVTSFGPNAYKQYLQGFHDAQITCTFFADFAGSSTHQALQPLYAAGGTIALEVRPTSQARSVTNPSALMTGTMYAYTGRISGKVWGTAADVRRDLRERRHRRAHLGHQLDQATPHRRSALPRGAAQRKHSTYGILSRRSAHRVRSHRTRR